jgi:hypothetical protein
MYYDEWLRAPYMVENPHHEGCAGDNDPSKGIACTCREITEQLRQEAADAKRELALEP